MKKNSAQEAWTLAQWQVYAESPSGVWEVVNENAKHISAYNVQRLALHNCTQFATCTARDESEIKTSWEWLSWEDTITIKKKSKHKIQIQKQQNIVNNTKRQKHTVVVKRSFKYYSRSNFNPTHRRKCPEIRKRSPHQSIFNNIWAWSTDPSLRQLF